MRLSCWAGRGGAEPGQLFRAGRLRHGREPRSALGPAGDQPSASVPSSAQLIQADYERGWKYSRVKQGEVLAGGERGLDGKTLERSSARPLSHSDPAEASRARSATLPGGGTGAQTSHEREMGWPRRELTPADPGNADVQRDTRRKRWTNKHAARPVPACACFAKFFRHAPRQELEPAGRLGGLGEP